MRYQGAHSDVLEKQKESKKSACYREVQNQLSSILGPTTKTLVQKLSADQWTLVCNIIICEHKGLERTSTNKSRKYNFLLNPP